ncbi:MAG: adenine deaminase [Saprospiraceae bacterium]|nr:adenine deaminase [Saprospiraceae bacterium]
MTILTANLIDIPNKQIFPARVTIFEGKIHGIEKIAEVPASAGYLLPGFVDAHVHVESSMLPPAAFARMAVVHGTVGSVSDPHEIANVLGEEGVHYMLEDGANSPFKFCFGAPSCVPATPFETAGAHLGVEAVERLLQHPDIGYLSEMMNFPGVLYEDAEVMAKLAAARKFNKPIDGHAPGLRGKEAQTYFSAGISTDHECFTLEEAMEKASLGVQILIREGSAARNFEALWPLFEHYPAQLMFCSDDKHPDDLVKGHINQLVARALAKGCDLFDVLHAACVHPVKHYQLAVGLLREGDPADCIRVRDLEHFIVEETWIDGVCVAHKGTCLIPEHPAVVINQFKATPQTAAAFAVPSREKQQQVRLIQVLDGQIVTASDTATLAVVADQVLADQARDILKIAVLNRYVPDAKPAVAFVRGFGLTHGALASSVAHDSHNIVAVGTDDEVLAEAINAVIAAKGGISACDGMGETRVLPLPIAGLMSTENGWDLAEAYAGLDTWTKERLGCELQAPFMTLSFLALPVIPALKITDKGLFDVETFQFSALFP